MGEEKVIPFAGTIVRTEPGGFGIIRFDYPLGPGRANSYGIISNSTGTSTASYVSIYDRLKPGVRVSGLAEADSQHEWAKIKIISTILPST